MWYLTINSAPASHDENAIRLLAMIGYDPKIIEAAQESAKHFEETGVWK